MTVEENLREYIDSLWIVDTHEHLQLESDWVKLDEDVLAQWLTHYFPYDMVSAGLPASAYEGPVRDSSKPLSERWKMVEPYWDAARNTGYGRALDIAARDLYGVPHVDGKTIHELNAKFIEARKATLAGNSHYKYVLKDKSRIDVSVTYLSESRPIPKEDRSFFRNVSAMDIVLAPATALEVEKVSAQTSIRIHSLDDWAAAAPKRVEADFAAGAVTLKNALAYERPIHYPRTTTLTPKGNSTASSAPHPTQALLRRSQGASSKTTCSTKPWRTRTQRACRARYTPGSTRATAMYWPTPIRNFS